MKWLALPILLVASTAHADLPGWHQCAWVSSDIAEHAKEIVESHAVSWFCQTCGGSYEPPGEPKVPASVDVYIDPDRGAAVKKRDDMQTPCRSTSGRPLPCSS